MRPLLKSSSFRFQNEYFLFGLPLFFVLHGYTDHFGEIQAKDAFFLALEYLAYVLLTSTVCALFFRSFRKGAIFSFLLFCFYYFFGATHDALKEGLGASFLVSYSFILPFSFFAFAVLFICLKKTGRQFCRLTRYLNIVLVFLLLIDVVMLTVQSDNLKAAPVQAETPVQPPAAVLPSANTATYPDIHLIVADEYAGRTALQQVLSFDNTAFEDSLRRRGFQVIESPSSNYNYTVASMASFFSMDYLPGLTNKPDAEIYRLGKEIIGKNRLTNLLRSKGYELKNFSIFDLDGLPPFAEPYFPQQLDLITRNTFFARLKADIGYHAALTFRLRSELQKVEKDLRWEAEAESRKMDSVVKEVATPCRAPRFFYTHLLMPHAPYLMDKEENLVRLDQNLFPHKKREERDLYLGYLQYTSKKLLQFIDRIRQSSAKPPVILLMSDHGLRRDWVPTHYYFSTINAVYFPGTQGAVFYPRISNVNQGRVLVNTLFGAHLPMLPDTSILLNGKNINPALGKH